MIMRAKIFLAAALFFGAAASGAHAHAFLVKSEPKVGTTVTKPALLRLEFSEAVELGFSGVDVGPAAGGTIAISGVRFADDGHKVLLAKLPMLGPGVYRVKWHVVSVDTHRTEGDFNFTVKP
jgi:methionine-rich copper-binding protein CopC